MKINVKKHLDTKEKSTKDKTDQESNNPDTEVKHDIDLMGKCLFETKSEISVLDPEVQLLEETRDKQKNKRKAKSRPTSAKQTLKDGKISLVN